MLKIRTIIADDEPLALRGMRLRLQEFADIEIVAECPNGKVALKEILKHKPDLVFLDIQMPVLDGFGVVKSLVGEEMPLVVFVTAFDEYALAAFQAHAVDYLLKPVEEDRLEEAIKKIRKQLEQHSAIEQNARIVKLIENLDDPPQTVLYAILEAKKQAAIPQYENQINIKDRGVITRVFVSDINYVEAAGDYMCIHTDAKTHILRATMKNMTKCLNPKVFQRVHRSIIVNLDRVKALHPHSNGEYFLILENDEELKVSRTYKNVVRRFS
jgi:two-component system LytT family response regulator